MVEQRAQRAISRDHPTGPAAPRGQSTFAAAGYPSRNPCGIRGSEPIRLSVGSSSVVTDELLDQHTPAPAAGVPGHHREGAGRDGRLRPGLPDAGEKAEILVRSTRLISQQEALRLRAVAAAGDVAADHGCRTVADWIAPRTRTDRRAAYAQEKLAHALDQTWHHVGAALADGRMHLDQARVIVKALDALPDDVGAEVKQLAEQRLVEDAEHFGPTDLARLGRRVLDVVAPEVGDEQERRALERAERKADSVTRLDFKRRGDGSTDIAATVPDAVAARLKTYLEAFTSPTPATPPAATAPTPPPAYGSPPTGNAASVLRPPGTPGPQQLPDHGGLATTMVVTMPLETLKTGLGTAQLGTGETITAGEARRLACTAGLVPAVLGTKSEVLDLGRTARLLWPAQQLVESRLRSVESRTGCATQRTQGATQRTGGATNGPLDPAAGVLLCHWHHKRAHDTRYPPTACPTAT